METAHLCTCHKNLKSGCTLNYRQGSIVMKAETSARIGMYLVISGLLVQVPLIILVMLNMKGFDVTQNIEKTFYISSAVGIALVATGGSAYIGSTIVTQTEHRGFLVPAWLVMISGIVFISSGYLLSQYMDKDLHEVLSLDFIGGNLGITTFVVLIVAVPELGVVSGLVCVSIHHRVNKERLELEERLEIECLEHATLRMEHKKLRDEVETSIEKAVTAERDRVANRYKQRFAAVNGAET